MLRCRKQGIEAVVVVVELFRPTHCRKSPYARGDTGAGIRLPGGAPSLVIGP
jgi:hypothetical protein